jgi:hypothetical protein
MEENRQGKEKAKDREKERGERQIREMERQETEGTQRRRDKGSR